MMIKMHVPAYCPIFSGVHFDEYSGVMVLVKKVMDIMDIVIMVSFVVVVIPLISISIFAGVCVFCDRQG